MNSAFSFTFDPRRLRQMTWLVLLAWSLGLGASLFWNVHLLQEAMVEAVATSARSEFTKDVLYRKWATLHGGVYVPITELTPPNPYLTNGVERDIVTTTGRRLTLVNPAYMTRQVHELETQEQGSHGHITSLKPLRPENAPDAWEASALRALTEGKPEVVAQERRQGQAYLRLMRPLVTEVGCLKCHGVQGYRVGDIRGGISIAVPMAPYVVLAQARTWRIGGAHAGLWLLGGLGIWLGGRQMRRRVEELQLAETALQHSETKFRTLFEGSGDAVMLLEEGRICDGNPAALAMFGCATREEFCGLRPAEVSPLVQPCGTNSQSLSIQHMIRAVSAGSHRFEWLHRRVGNGASAGEIFPAEVLLTAMMLDGRPMLQAAVRDITERKRTEEKLVQLSRAVEQCPASIVITDVKGDIVYANPKFLEVTGYGPTEVLGQNPRVLKSGDKGPEVYRDLWETISAGREWRGEFHNRRKNGELYWESASISPIRDLEGRVTHYVAVKEDITARKLAEEERERLLHELQQAMAKVKSLSGLLPICAGCKKIRDDQGYWSQVESYIQKHSQATFTHGMCPQCAKKYFPELPDGE